jgi:hypothetical protein
MPQLLGQLFSGPLGAELDHKVKIVIKLLARSAVTLFYGIPYTYTAYA